DIVANDFVGVSVTVWQRCSVVVKVLFPACVAESYYPHNHQLQHRLLATFLPESREFVCVQWPQLRSRLW
ncbi:MAG: hypothetical protein P1U52_12575, partial [Porticoccaceae bacterium]|nr:hypothetical protein [Porticoccaceae bacterium]